MSSDRLGVKPLTMIHYERNIKNGKMDLLLALGQRLPFQQLKMSTWKRKTQALKDLAIKWLLFLIDTRRKLSCLFKNVAVYKRG